MTKKNKNNSKSNLRFSVTSLFGGCPLKLHLSNNNNVDPEVSSDIRARIGSALHEISAMLHKIAWENKKHPSLEDVNVHDITGKYELGGGDAHEVLTISKKIAENIDIESRYIKNIVEMETGISLDNDFSLMEWKDEYRHGKRHLINEDDPMMLTGTPDRWGIFMNDQDEMVLFDEDDKSHKSIVSQSELEDFSNIHPFTYQLRAYLWLIDEYIIPNTNIDKYQGRINLVRYGHIKSVEFTKEDIKNAKDHARDVIENMNANSDKAIAGKHCQYCDYKIHCANNQIENFHKEHSVNENNAENYLNMYIILNSAKGAVQDLLNDYINTHQTSVVHRDCKDFVYEKNPKSKKEFDLQRAFKIIKSFGINPVAYMKMNSGLFKELPDEIQNEIKENACTDIPYERINTLNKGPLVQFAHNNGITEFQGQPIENSRKCTKQFIRLAIATNMKLEE